MPNEGRERRRYFRLTYPITMRPSLKIGVETYQVIEISEMSIKFLCRDLSFHIGQIVPGVISFADRMSMSIQGKVLRFTRHDVVVTLLTPLPMKTVIEEQRLVIAKNKPQ